MLILENDWLGSYGEGGLTIGRNKWTALDLWNRLSATHVAFTSSRVMATCGVIGQAAGTAAALCARHGLTPRRLYENKARLNELQQTLLRDDQTIKNLGNEDAADLARKARVKASAAFEHAEADNILNGIPRDIPGKSINRWTTVMTPEGPWIELRWEQAQTLREVQFTLDSGFQRELTLSASDGINRGIIRAAQPETVRDYTLLYRKEEDGPLVPLVQIEGNYQRLNRHRFQAIAARALRLHIRATNGDKLARVFEIRCYG